MSHVNKLEHFTVDKNFSNFRDHSLSADFIDLKNLVNSIRKIELQLGEFNKKILKPEKKVVKLNRRGIYAKRKIIKGEKISSVNSAFLRPSNTNDFLYIKKIIDKKIKKPKKQNQRIC